MKKFLWTSLKVRRVLHRFSGEGRWCCRAYFNATRKATAYFYRLYQKSICTSSKNISNDSGGLELVVNSLSELLKIEILNISDEAINEGINSMMSDFIAEQEKTIWMLNSWLGK